MKKIAVIICLIIALLGVLGIGTYHVYNAVTIKNNDTNQSNNNEHEDIVEDVEFKVFNADGQELPRISSIEFIAGSTYTFKVSKDYTLDVIPNDTIIASNIGFKVNGEYKNFRKESSLLNGFNVVKGEDNTFTIDLSSGSNLQSVLEKIYDSDIDMEISNIIKKDKIFTIVIRALGSNDVRYIDFGINTYYVDLSPEDIVIG